MTNVENHFMHLLVRISLLTGKKTISGLSCLEETHNSVLWEGTQIDWDYEQLQLCMFLTVISLSDCATAFKGAYHKGSQSIGVFFISTFIASLVPLCKKGHYLFRLLVGMNFLDLVRDTSF